MLHSPSRDTDISSAGQEIPRALWHLKFHYPVYKTFPSVPFRVSDSVVGVATATGWTDWGSNPGGLFRTAPDRPWGPLSLYSGYRVSFLEVKPSERGVYHPTPSSAEVKERVELYLYSPSGPSWPVGVLWILFVPLSRARSSQSTSPYPISKEPF